jgi:hypothetical protein
MKYLFKKDNCKIAPGLINIGQKAARQMTAPRIEKETAYFNSGWCLQMGEVEDNDNDNEWEPVELITSPCYSNSGY